MAQSRREILILAAVLMGLPSISSLGCTHDTLVGERNLSTKSILVNLNESEYLALKIIGGSAYVIEQSEKRSIILTRLEQDTFIAVSSECTHAGCDVNLYDPQTNVLRCDCHNSAFKADGLVIGGPAQKPLKQFIAQFDGHHTVQILLS